MAYTLIIQQKGGLFKSTPNLAVFQKQFGGFLQFGGIGSFGQFLPQPGPPAENREAEYMLYSKESPLGRGFYLYIDKGFTRFEITTPLPTTRHDLEDMFAFAGALAKHLRGNELSDHTGTFNRAYLPTIFSSVLESNLDLLYQAVVAKKDFHVSGVQYPLWIPETLVTRMQNVPPVNGEQYFSAYLSEKQNFIYTYLAPELTIDEETQQPVARYTIQEAVPYIMPREPFIPSEAGPFAQDDISRWEIVFKRLSSGVPIGTISYQDCLDRMIRAEKQEHDEKHFIMSGLSLPRIKEIIEGI